MQCITLDDTSLISTCGDDSLDNVTQVLVDEQPKKEELSSEPIYSVIDLKAKHQKRWEKSNKQPFSGETGAPLIASPSPSPPGNVHHSTSPSSLNTAQQNETDDEKPPSPGYAYVRHLSHHNLSTNNNNNNNRSSKGSDHKEHSAKIGSEGERPKSCQFFSSADYEEVKLENPLFKRDFVFLSK